MWNLIFFSAVTVFNVNTLYVSGNQSCGQVVFVQNSAENNLLFNNGLLLEASVSSRAECVSLSHLHDACNLLLYNPSTALCRLHDFDYANDVGVTSAGWENYARQCTGPQTTACFLDNVWKGNEMCIRYETSLNNIGGANEYLDYDFEVGMVVNVKGDIRESANTVGACLDDSGDSKSFLCIEFKLGAWCSTFTVDYNDDCAGVLPPIDTSDVLFTFQLTSDAIKILVDGIFIKQYQDDITRNQLGVYGFDDIDQVKIISEPDSCN